MTAIQSRSTSTREVPVYKMVTHTGDPRLGNIWIASRLESAEGKERSMRAVRNSAEGISVVAVDEPTGAGVRLEVTSVGICGSDVNLAAGLGGFTYGHEFAGVAADGREYAVEPNIHCGRCEQCRLGATQRCTDAGHGFLGVYQDGGMCDAIVVPDYTLAPLPTGLPGRDACLVEPASVAWHGVQRAALAPGERLAVVGGGSIGLLTVAASRRMGFQVDLAARHPHQAAAGERLGAGSVDGGYNVVIDAAGSEAGLARCVELARPGGRVVLLGVYQPTIPVPGMISLVKELSFVNAVACGRRDGVREFERAAAMLAENPGISSTVITHRFPLADAAEAFRVAGDRSAGAIKVVLHP
ncbi:MULTISPECIES: zinc-dependent alcohol dehydrogenase [Protofrankia]|uniref:zinc-dependent alcohol dehydrogenase n=1 Tax=Protofrankia TaxID=2994361 RepID=UPI001F49C777|nr:MULTISPECIES: alcohol dehydrogenase catalytic domain-containing protein [Protofrankia]